MILKWFFLSFSLSFAKANNVAITSSGIAIAASGGGGGLILQQSASSSSVKQALPTGIASFDDVSIDAGNEALVFALSTTSRQVCSFTLSDGGLTLVNCVGEGDNFQVSPFCGVSALDSTLIISGGVGGLTIYQYDNDSGVISDSPTVLNLKLQGVVGHPDVVLVNGSLAALSTDFSAGFGTLMASIQESDVNNVLEFRVENSLEFEFFATSKPANFPLVNAIYETETSTYMYTANGPMQVQEPLVDNTIDILSGAPTGFLAVTVAVNTAKKIAVFGGVNSSGENQILFYDLSVDPRNPSLVESVPVTGQRILSIASGGDVAAYTTLNLATIQYEQLPSTPTSSPVASPTDIPVITPTSSPVASLTNSPVIPTTSNPVASPTDIPVIQPTSSPVASPTNSPVVQPTSSPVASLTNSPVIPTTSNPVASPTDIPVIQPTSSPSASLTNSPVVQPTGSPVASLTNSPVIPPTASPIALSLSKNPSSLPSELGEPTGSPSKAILDELGDIPTETPSSTPVSSCAPDEFFDVLTLGFSFLTLAYFLHD